MTRKKIIIISVFILLIVVGWVGWKYAYPEYKTWRFLRDALNITRGIEDYLAKDTYGGQTPEETYNLYVDALKRGDTEAASQYFYWERQVPQKTKLDALSAKGELNKYIADLPKWSEMREEEYGDKDSKQYSYEFIQEKDQEYYDEALGRNDILKAGKYRSFMDFQFNKQASIWKIYSL
ncbi:hypothetical protein KJ590_02760 [Patescibacteria group bacterium]|nr:hypothetical protein [Patescibacteria group bacterium]